MRLTPTERLIVQQSRQAPGIGGRSANEAPVRPRPRGDLLQGGLGGEPIFDFPGPLVVSTSGIYLARGDESFVLLAGVLTQSGSTDTVAELLVNGVAADSLTIPAGDTDASTSISVTLAVGDYLQGRVATPGDDAVELLLFPRSS